MQLPKLCARLNPELVHEDLARPPVGVERVRLAAAAVEREHQLSVQALAPRVLARELSELADQFSVVAGGEVGLDPQLDRAEPLLLEPGDLVSREWFVGEVGERRAPPQPQRLAQDCARLVGLVCRERMTALRHQGLEPLRVELALPHAEAVAGRGRDDQVRIAERLAQPRDIDLHPLPRAGRCVLPPQHERQPLGAHRLVGVEDEHGQQRARLDAAERHRVVIGTHLERTEDRELHRWQADPTPALSR